jgi:hypothetical protein
MRKAGIALTILGVSVFAALAVWGLSLSTASADDETATATPEATETVEATATPQTCAPVIPGTYNGTVTVNGAPAPDGTTVTASIGGVTWATDTTSGGRYVFDVPATLPTTEPCFSGGDIAFACDGAAAAETATWNSGLHDLNLTCGAAATATVPVPPPATETVTVVPPTGTAVVPPPTGMGSGGAGGGFLWWPLALAAAALTAVAGLYTARRATR